TMHFGLEMWKYAKTLKLRAENAEMSHCHRPNAEAFLMGVNVKINGLGLRDRDDISKDKPRDTYRIVVLGDSTTLGWGAPFESLYCKVLERSLNSNPPSARWRKSDHINTGTGNHNRSRQVASYKEHWRALAPNMAS